MKDREQHRKHPIRMILGRKVTQKTQFALCIENSDCEDLEKRKLYQILPDEAATQEGYMRVIDESGEDYLYPESYFILVELPCQAEEVLVATN